MTIFLYHIPSFISFFIIFYHSISLTFLKCGVIMSVMKERVKFDLEFLKTLFFFVLTALCAVIGYGIANFETLTKIQIALGYIVGLVLLTALFFSIIGLLKVRKLMEDLK